MATPTIDLVLEATKIIARQDGATQGAGSARGLQTSSATKILSTLAPVALQALAWFIAFLIVRRWYPRFYSPRTYNTTIPPQERSPEVPRGLVNWFANFFKVSDYTVLNNQQTLDGYLFLRLLRLSVVSCFVGCLITWPILLPINATGKGGQRQFNLLTWSNVASPTYPSSYYRYYAHVVCAWLYFTYIIWAITRESLYYISLRQAYLVSPLYANRISSRTVLFMSVPNKYLDEEVIRELLGRDQIKNIWIPLNTDELEDLVSERDDLLSKLENAEVKLIKSANSAKNKAIKKGGDIPLKENGFGDESDESGSIAARWVKPQDRPTHRTGPLGLWGPKVDTINYCREQLPEKLSRVKELQDEHRAFKGKTRNSVFVQFHTLRDAQSAFQSLTHHQPLHMAPRYIGMQPDEIIWYNLRTKWWERIIRLLASIGIVSATIIGWSFPVAFIASISNVNFLTTIKGLGWLDFINHMGPVSGVVTGLLPSLLLSFLMSLLPPFLRLMARLGGDPTLSAVEYTIQTTYYWFYILQGFLVTTFSTGAIQAAARILNDPTQVINLLANSLPAASNFYLSFFILQGLSVASGVLANLWSLLAYIIFSRYLDGTPRKKFKRLVDLVVPTFGTYYPIYTTFFVIAISYSCIAPLVSGFGMVGLLLFYLAYRYNFIFVYQTYFDTKGLMYARALQQLFVGIYLANGCMIGLFAINLGNSTVLLGPMILMIIYLVFTILYHISLNAALSPLLQFLPKTLETEERRLLAVEESESDADVEDQGHERATHSETPRTSTGTRPDQFRASNGDTPLTAPMEKVNTNKTASSVPPPSKAPNFFMKWLRPDKYTDYYTLRHLVPRSAFDIEYSEEEERDAYFHPAVRKEPDLLWVPRDELGVSRQEVRHTSRITPITDEGAALNEKGDLVWESSKAVDAPIYEQRVYY